MESLWIASEREQKANSRAQVRWSDVYPNEPPHEQPECVCPSSHRREAFAATCAVLNCEKIEQMYMNLGVLITAELRPLLFSYFKTFHNDTYCSTTLFPPYFPCFLHIFCLEPQLICGFLPKKREWYVWRLCDSGKYTLRIWMKSCIYLYSIYIWNSHTKMHFYVHTTFLWACILRSQSFWHYYQLYFDTPCVTPHIFWWVILCMCKPYNFILIFFWWVILCMCKPYNFILYYICIIPVFIIYHFVFVCYQFVFVSS